MRFLETITAWERLGTRPDGQPNWSEPISVKARWEDNNRLFVGTDGREERSQAVVYVDKKIPEGWKVFRGKSTASEPPVGSIEVRQFREIPNLFGTKTEKRVML